MTALAHEQQPKCSRVAEAFLNDPTAFIELIWQSDGPRIEYVEGAYYVTPPADNQHNAWALDIAFQFRSRGVEGVSIGNGYCSEPPGSEHVTGAFIPNVAILKRSPDDTDERFRENHHGWYPSDLLQLVGEITSPSNHLVDKRAKYFEYARAGIPVYVLIDRQKNEAVVFSHPIQDGDDSRYRTTDRVKIGEMLPLPDGLPAIDTSQLT